MNKFYSMLMQFTNETQCSRTHLQSNYSNELIDEALKNGYIVEIRNNVYGDPIYMITTKGKEKRDR